MNSGWPGSTSRKATEAQVDVRSLLIRARQKVDFPAPLEPVIIIEGGEGVECVSGAFFWMRVS